MATLMALSAIGSNAVESITRHMSRVKVDIVLHDQPSGFVVSYTTGDRIKGEVIITAEQDTKFDAVDITFEGATNTSVEGRGNIHPSITPKAYHSFFNMKQPIDSSQYPEPRVFSAKKVYRFPFTFVVPDRLLPHICSHSLEDESDPRLHHAHTQLPPSLGDPMIAGDGVRLIDDMAPEFIRISYMIRATIRKKSNSSSSSSDAVANSTFRTIAAVAKKVRIIPKTHEQPLLDKTLIDDFDSDYSLRKEKEVRRGLLRGKMGRLTVEAAQPKALEVPSSRRKTSNDDDSEASTSVSLHLRFDPESPDEQPPSLRSLATKLKVMTFYSAKPWTRFPSMSSIGTIDPSQGVYSESITLSRLCLARAQWEKHGDSSSSPLSDNRRASCQSTSSWTSSSSSFYPGKTYYTTSVVAPISLPRDKSFVPTFHSCLVSRIYALDVSISYQTPNANVVAPSISLRLPLQITSSAGQYPRDSKTLLESVDPLEEEMARLWSQEDEDAFFRSRSTVAPPEYSLLAGTRQLRKEQEMSC
ncbi:hypothetical protein VTN49DRAFT_5617 [Thermomyces lanuginosus]|uniref:uncharacterized protein n=1 Tax=Thermomyces lanuginosus TaxID=5541 RepID=UPI0037434D21